MKRTIKGIICIFLVTVLLGSSIPLSFAETAFPSETDPFGENYYIDATNQEEPFFEKVLPEIAKNIKENNKHTISPYYDKLPLANNPENFQGLGSTSYANINGKTVTAEAFYRVKGDTLCDPNAGMGLLIYQCIQYKLKHPEAPVEMTFSTYRTSVTASVCVIPESRYYGYMRSLYTTNYDEHGFVRISYMFTEAARLGIKVTLLNQLPSYGVKQYNPSTKALKTRNYLHFDTYFKKALETDCYDSFAPGKKVSDFMNYIRVGWTVKDQTANMQHVKSCTVSHYLATDGSEHQHGVFFTTANLDENDYMGCNGNGWSQSGVIISDHEALYRVTLNYTDLMVKYSYMEGIQEFRKYVTDMNYEQLELIRNGKENEIPKNEQIVYLGSETDKVFQLYFTPLATAVDAWDTENNPICEHVDKMAQSEDYIEFAWNEYGFEENYLGLTIGDMLEKAFTENKNPKNKISVCVSDLDIAKIKKLSVGKDIAYRSIKTGKNMHAKDFLLSYEEDGVRHNVSILTSCNYIMLAFHYRTNSILVINETEDSGGNFYNIFGSKYANGMIHKDGVHSFKSPSVTKATLSKDGKITSKCSCGETQTEVISRPAEFILSKTEFTADGTVKTPEITVKDADGNTLKEDTDYTVTYPENSKEPGNYNIKLTFKGNYSGEKAVGFVIKADEEDFLLGDTNLDGKVKAEDARLALRFSVGLEKLSPLQQKAADMITDGKVRAEDARAILRTSVGLPVK